MIIAELPTGLIADKYGKKISILVAKVLMIIYLVLMLFSNSVIGFYAAAILMGIAYTFTSGAEEAFLYDMIKQSGIEERATKYMGLYEGIITISIALAMGVAGYIQAINWSLVFIISIIFQLVSLGIGVTLKEVEVQCEDNVDNHRLGYREIIMSCVDFLKNNKNTRGYIIATSLNVGVVSSLYIFAQDILVNNGFDVKKVSMFFSVESIISALVFTQVYKLVDKIGRNKSIYYLVGVTVASYAWLIGLKSYILIPIFMISIANNACTTISFVMINEKLEDEKRATMLSIYSLISAILMVVISVSINSVVRIMSMEMFFGIMGAGLILYYIVSYKKIEKETEKCNIETLR
ncbi:MFS transporter [Hathewaya histolytica]|uniref:MFS transporter n=1 Tax=Hathewaya histolytica TaxID=1498 RepID=UPI003B67665F